MRFVQVPQYCCRRGNNINSPVIVHVENDACALVQEENIAVHYWLLGREVLMADGFKNSQKWDAGSCSDCTNPVPAARSVDWLGSIKKMEVSRRTISKISKYFLLTYQCLG